MDLLNWLQNWLGITDLQKRVDILDERMASIEALVETTLDNFGNYKSRTTEELKLMKKVIDNILHTLDNTIESLEYDTDLDRAKRLRRRLRNNQTRINKAIAA